MQHFPHKRDRLGMEARRFAAVRDVRAGRFTQAAAARHYAVTPGAVSQWMTAYRTKGRSALKKTDATGRPSRLSPAQVQQAARALLQGPEAFGYRTGLWTLARVAAVVRRETGIRYRPTQTWRFLRKLGWSVQKPETRARERNERAIARWLKDDWPVIQKRGFV